MGVLLQPQKQMSTHITGCTWQCLGHGSHLFLLGDGLPATASCICCSWRTAASACACSLRAAAAAWGGERGGESAASYSTTAMGRAALA